MIHCTKKTVPRFGSIQNRKSKIQNRAFTLLEILIAISILTIIAASLSALLVLQSRSSSKIAARTDRFQSVRNAVDDLSRELASVLIPHFGFPYWEGRSDSLQFMSVGSTKTPGGFKEVGYYYDSGRRVLRKRVEEEPDFLFRQMQGSDPILAEGITSFSLTYFSATDWRLEWDPQTGDPETAKLPVAVKVRLTVADEKQRESPQTFETIIRVPGGE